MAMIGRYNIVRNVWEWGYWQNNALFKVVFTSAGE
jgi:hypothetical protein